MPSSPFHLGWFIDGLRPPAWNRTWSGTSNYDWANKFYIDMARSLDRAKFTFMLFADSPRLYEGPNGSFEQPLKLGRVSLDPLALAPILAHETQGIGIFPTASVTDWSPYMLARLLSSIDHVTDARTGWNMVTGGSKLAAANLGCEELPHDTRYELAHEFLEAATQLWSSWGADSVVCDHERDIYADGSKVAPIDFAGRYFRTRGPLTMPPTPQGRPVLAQAGASPAGRDFAARFADVVIGSAGGTVEGMKAYRKDILERAAAYGRKPSEIRVFFMITPHLAGTQAEAEERLRLSRLSPESDMGVAINLLGRSTHWNIDLSKFDLDKPLPADLTTEGHQSELENAIASGRTLREIVSGMGDDHVIHLVGTPATVSDQMEEIMQEVGGDGLMIFSMWLDRRFIAEVTDGLVPVLQRRGLVRRDYSSRHFRDNLFAY